MPVSRSILALFHYRGRCSRTGFIVFGAILLGIQISIGVVLMALGRSPDGPLGLILNLPLFWLAFTALVRRLHDIGHSGWWVVGAIFVSVVWTISAGLGAGLVLDPNALTPEHAQFYLLVVVVLLPPMSMVVWVHAKPGFAGTNRHGPVPEGFGFVATPDLLAATDTSAPIPA